MNFFQWLKFKSLYNKQIKKAPDEAFKSLVSDALKLFPESIDISAGELRGKNGFWSENLADAWHNAEKGNLLNSQELDFMIWSVYGVLHKQSIKNFKEGIMTVTLHELNPDEIRHEYIKAWIEADFC